PLRVCVGLRQQHDRPCRLPTTTTHSTTACAPRAYATHAPPPPTSFRTLRAIRTRTRPPAAGRRGRRRRTSRDRETSPRRARTERAAAPASPGPAWSERRPRRTAHAGRDRSGPSDPPSRADG